MSELQIFSNEEFELHVTPEGDSFHVEAPGLARALGFREAYDLVQSIPDEEKGSGLVRTLGGEQELWHVKEPGFYRAIGQRQAARVKDVGIREQVIRFQNWVYREVLPAIRRTGSYSVVPSHATPPLPPTFAEALRAYADEVEAHGETKVALAEAQPAAEAWNVLADAKGDYSLREAAQILDRDPHINTGQNRLSRFLQEIGWTDQTNQPYQAQVDAKRLRRRSTSFLNLATGEREPSWQIRITAKGVKDLRVLMLGRPEPLALAAAEQLVLS